MPKMRRSTRPPTAKMKHSHHGLPDHFKNLNHRLYIGKKAPKHDPHIKLRGDFGDQPNENNSESDGTPELATGKAWGDTYDYNFQEVRKEINGPVPEEREEPNELQIGSWIDWAWSRSDTEVKQFIYHLLQMKMGELAIAENASERDNLDKTQERLIREYMEIQVPH